MGYRAAAEADAVRTEDRAPEGEYLQ
jgi:hypothetical protein